MPTWQKPQTADEQGLMCGFPPVPEKMVTHENQLLGPYNRWSFLNELKLNHTADVWRGNGAVSEFITDLRDLGRIVYQNRAGATYTFDEMVEMTCTDGILILQAGKIIYERYLNGMQPHTLHAWASCSKSMTGSLAALLVYEGIIDLDTPVGIDLPELKNSGFADAPLRYVMDMTSGIGFLDDRPDPVSEDWRYSIAAGWRNAPAGYESPATISDFLPSMVKTTEHGARFNYLTPNTDVLAWLMKRRLNQTLSEIMCERIWLKMGCERDAFWIVDSGMAETAGSGLVTTLRDMARFGQLMLQKGRFNGRQIIPPAVIEDIMQGGDRQAFARGPAAGHTNQGWSYHNQWWITHNSHRAYFGLGYGGQMLYIDPAAQLVITKFSSYPTPTPAGNEFYGMFAAIPALVEALAAYS